MEAALLVVLIPMVLEQLTVLVAPQLLARFAFIELPLEHEFTLPERPPIANELAGYREQAVRAPALPSLPWRTVLDGSVLFSDGSGSFTLRRAFGYYNRAIWLVRIDVEQSGRTVRLRAKEALYPITALGVVPLASLVVLRGAGASAAIGVFVGFGIGLGLLFLQRAFTASSRDEAIARACLHIELGESADEER
jgi:hypothetical protein